MIAGMNMGSMDSMDSMDMKPSNNGMSGVINLSKGQKINLSKSKPSLKKIMVGLGWDVAVYSGSADFDLDASVFLQDEQGRTEPHNFIFYNNLSSVDGSVVHQGDNRTGDGDGDDEKIFIDLTKLPENIKKIAIVVTIDSADVRGQNFGMVDNAYCRLVNDETGEEEARFDLGEDFSLETAVVIGEVYKYNNDWNFRAIGQGFNGGLLAVCNRYGLQAEYR